MPRPLLLAAALAASACAPKLALRYAPGAPEPLLPPLRFHAEAGAEPGAFELPRSVKLKPAGRPEEELRAAVEAELGRLGWSPAPASEAQARVSVKLLRAFVHPWPGNAEVAFALELADREGAVVGRRIVRASTPEPAPLNRWGFQPAFERAFADAVGQLGTLLDGEGWAAKLAGRPPLPRGAGFPPAPGAAPPAVLLLPTEDPFGQLKQVEFGGLAHFWAPSVAEPFQRAVRERLKARGFRMAARRADADWVVRTSVAHAATELKGSIGGGLEATLRVAAQVEGRDGTLLWEGNVDARTGEAFLAASGKKALEAARAAASEAGEKLAAALEGRAPEELFAPAELAEAFRRAEKGGGIFGASGLALASGLARGLAAGSGLRRPEGAALKDAARLAGGLRAAADAAPIRAPEAASGVELVLLPLSNQSVSVDAPAVLRALLERELRGAGFRVRDLRSADEGLKRLGITDGGQLGARSPAELAAAAGGDLLLYGEVLAFDYKNLGVYASRTVELRLRLTRPSDGKTVWTAAKKRWTPKAALSAGAAGDLLLTGYGERLLENALKSPLAEEARGAARDLVRELADREDW